MDTKEEALDLFERALHILEASKSSDSRECAICCINLSKLKLEFGTF